MGLAARVTAGKACSCCGVLTPASGFYSHPTTRDRQQSQCKRCINTRKAAAFRKNPRNKSAHGTDEYWGHVDDRRKMLQLRYSMEKRARAAGRRVGYIEVKPAAFLGDMLAIGAYSVDMEKAHRQAPYIEMMALCEAFEAKLRK